MKVNQKGFSVVEILIIVVIVGLVGAVGWLVYDRQKSKADDKATTVQANQQEQEAPKQEEVKRPTYFEVKELGVRFELPDNLVGLHYSMGNNNRTAYFSLNELEGTNCAADKTAPVALTRYTDEDIANDYEPVFPKDRSKKIGNYYYYDIGGQAACSDDEKVQEKASQLRVDITKLLPNALVAL